MIFVFMLLFSQVFSATVFVPEAFVTSFAYDEEGNCAYYIHADYQLVVRFVNGKVYKYDLSKWRPSKFMAFDIHANNLVFVPNALGPSAILNVDLEEPKSIRMLKKFNTNEKLMVSTVSFSPDGKKLIYVVKKLPLPSHKAEVRMIDITNLEEKKILELKENYRGIGVAWNIAGNRVVVPYGEHSICFLNLESGEKRIIEYERSYSVKKYGGQPYWVVLAGPLFPFFITENLVGVSSEHDNFFVLDLSTGEIVYAEEDFMAWDAHYFPESRQLLYKATPYAGESKITVRKLDVFEILKRKESVIQVPSDYSFFENVEEDDWKVLRAFRIP